MSEGDYVNIKTGWANARLLFPMSSCEKCGRPGEDRHHKDNDPTNNTVDNVQILCRVCHSHTRSKLSEGEVLAIRHAIQDHRATQSGLARTYNVSRQAISDVILGKTYVYVSGPRQTPNVNMKRNRHCQGEI
jgi:hypothetical protein